MKRLLLALLLVTPAFAQVSPQITGAGAPTNPCYNGGQQYLDTTNHILYNCSVPGQNWVNIGQGNTQNPQQVILYTAIPSADQISAAGSFATTISVPNTNFKVGTRLHIVANGVYTTTATASPQNSFQVNAGGTSGMCSVPSAATIGTGIAGGAWNLECFIQINTLGPSGTAKAFGHYELANNVNGAEVIGNNKLFPNASTSTYNTAAPQTVSVQEVAALVSGQTYTLQALWVEVINP